MGIRHVTSFTARRKTAATQALGNDVQRLCGTDHKRAGGGTSFGGQTKLMFAIHGALKWHHHRLWSMQSPCMMRDRDPSEYAKTPKAQVPRRPSTGSMHADQESHVGALRATYQQGVIGIKRQHIRTGSYRVVPIPNDRKRSESSLSNGSAHNSS